MSKNTVSLLTTILLSTAIAAPTVAAAPAHHAFPRQFLARYGMHLQPEASALRDGRFAGAHRTRSAPSSFALDVYREPKATGDTLAYGINAGGSVTGEYIGSDGHTHGFLRNPDATFTEIVIGTDLTSAFWLNDKNWVTGDYLENGIVGPYARKPGGKIERIDLPDSQYADGLHINNSATATGDYVDSAGLWHGFIRAKDGTLTTFEEPKAATGADQGTFAGATNTAGDTIGPYVDADGILHGYIRHGEGSFTEFDVPDAVDTIPFIINAKGWVVGLSDDENGVTHGFIRRPSGKIIVVDAPDAGAAPGQGTTVADINKHGVATGNYIDTSGVSHGFLCAKDGTVIKEFDAPGAGPAGTTPVSINGSGVVSGYMRDDSNLAYGVIGSP